MSLENLLAKGKNKKPYRPFYYLVLSPFDVKRALRRCSFFLTTAPITTQTSQLLSTTFHILTKFPNNSDSELLPSSFHRRENRSQKMEGKGIYSQIFTLPFSFCSSSSVNLGRNRTLCSCVPTLLSRKVSPHL